MSRDVGSLCPAGGKVVEHAFPCPGSSALPATLGAAYDNIGFPHQSESLCYHHIYSTSGVFGTIDLETIINFGKTVLEQSLAKSWELDFITCDNALPDSSQSLNDMRIQVLLQDLWLTA